MPREVITICVMVASIYRISWKTIRDQQKLYHYYFYRILMSYQNICWLDIGRHQNNRIEDYEFDWNTDDKK